jgi:hypothetical protein
VAPRAPECLLEPLVVERLHQVVDGREVERLQCITIVGGHEDGCGHLVGADLAHDVEPGLAGHLHVEEHEVRLQRADRVDGRRAVVHAGDDLDARFGAQQIFDALPGERLVVDDENANRLAIGHERALGGDRRRFGMQIGARVVREHDLGHRARVGGATERQVLLGPIQLLEPSARVAQPDAAGARADGVRCLRVRAVRVRR